MKTMVARPRLVLEANLDLSESPVWVAEEDALYWADVTGQALNRLDRASGVNTRLNLGHSISSYALCEGGGFIAALFEGFAFLDTVSHRMSWVARPFARPEAFFLNDGRCDRSGRFFWAGSVDRSMAEKGGALFRLAGDGSCVQMAGGVIASNGLAFSPDNRVLYYADSYARIIWRFDHDPATGEIRNRQEFAMVPEGEGVPDGAAVDAEGHYWSARAFGSRIVRYRPDGSIERSVELPFGNPTMVAFGGPDLRTLYITSTSRRLGADEALRQKAGSIFALEVDVAGLPEPHFRADAAIRRGAVGPLAKAFKH